MKQVEERYISFEASKMAYRDIKNSIDTAKREGKFLFLSLIRVRKNARQVLKNGFMF